MSKWFRENAPISARQLTDEFQRLKRGSVTRRHFLGVTGLGLAAAVLARQPGLFNSAAYAQEDLGTSMSLATWPNYHDPATFEAFTAKTGVAMKFEFVPWPNFADRMLNENRAAINSFANDGLGQLGPTLGELRGLIRDLRRISDRLDASPSRFLLGRDAPKEFEP